MIRRAAAWAAGDGLATIITAACGISAVALFAAAAGPHITTSGFMAPAMATAWAGGTALLHVLIDPRPVSDRRADAPPARRPEQPADARGTAPHPVSGVAGCGALTRPRSPIAADRPAAHFPRAAGPATRPGTRGVSYRPGRVALTTTTTTIVLPGAPT